MTAIKQETNKPNIRLTHWSRNTKCLFVCFVWSLFICLFVCLFICLSVLCKFSNFFLQYKAAAVQKNVPRMNTDVLASYTQNIAQGQKNDSRINAVYSGCLVVRVGGSRLGVGLIKCSDIQRLLLARSISDLSVLTTRGVYVFIFSLCCLLFVCNVFTTPRAGHQSRPLPLVFFIYGQFHEITNLKILKHKIGRFAGFLHMKLRWQNYSAWFTLILDIALMKYDRTLEKQFLRY